MVNKADECPLTYEELQNLAKENYKKGGYMIVECYDKKVFDRYVETFGPITKRKALSLFAYYYEHRSENYFGDLSELE